MTERLDKHDRMKNGLALNPGVSELLEQWHKGSREEVADIAWRCPPHIAAYLALRLVLPQPGRPAGDPEYEANRFVNCLIDRFQEERP